MPATAPTQRNTLLNTLLAASLGALAAGCSTSEATRTGPTLTLDKARYELTEPAIITLGGLEPGQEVTLIATRPGEWSPDRLYRSESRWRADADGTISTARDVPLDGAWQTPDPYAPFWTMRRTDEPTPLGGDGSGDGGYDANEVRIAADIDGDGSPDLAAALWLETGQDRVSETPLGAGFPGAFTMRPLGSEGEELPVIVILGGSEGGDGSARFSAPRLARHGYVALGLPYHSPAYASPALRIEGLPSAFAELPVDYVAEAVAALAAQGGIDRDRVGLYGGSKGAELALLSASLSGGVCAIAANVPSDVVWEGWGDGSGEAVSGFSWQGEPLAFVPYLGMDEAIARLSRGEPASIREPHDAGRAANPDRVEPARIRVEDIAVPVFLVGGDRDRTWDSGGMTRAIKARRDAAGLQTVALVFEDAGHGLSGSAWRPAEAPEARARREAWPAMLDFFADTLKQGDCRLSAPQ